MSGDIYPCGIERSLIDGAGDGNGWRVEIEDNVSSMPRLRRIRRIAAEPNPNVMRALGRAEIHREIGGSVCRPIGRRKIGAIHQHGIIKRRTV